MKLTKFIEMFNDDVFHWIKTHYLRIGIFNGLVMLLVLLRSAGYFHPYLPISVNIVVVLALIFAIFLLDARSVAFYLIALLFWLFAGVLRIVGVDIWSERTSVYAFQAFLLGTLLLFIETSGIITKRKTKDN